MALIHVLAVLALASVQDDDERPPRAVAPVFSVAGGYAIPFGNLFKSDEINVNNAMKGGFPLHFEAGVALWTSWHVVAYVDYAFLDRSQRCLPTDDCTGNTLRLGGQIQYWGSGRYGWTPFIGIGGGWEKLSLNFSDGSLGFSGFEGNVTGGLIYFFNHWFGLGPYFEARVGAYSTIDVSNADGGGSSTIRDQAMHGWLTLGLRIDIWP